MKHHGSKSEHEHRRNRDLLRAYKEHLRDSRLIFLPSLLKKVVESPSERFWVSSERAAIVIARLDKGDTLDEMRPLKREMFLEIYRRACIIRDNNPGMPVSRIAEDVVMQPAPKFYLTAASAKVIICRIRRRMLNSNGNG